MHNTIKSGFHFLFLTAIQYKTFVKFCIVGCFVTALDFFIFGNCFYIFKLGPISSKLIAFSNAVMVSYALTRIWSFRSRSSRVLQQFPKFLFVSLIGAGLSSI